MGKKRFLIFLFILPAIASAYAVIHILTGAVVDSFSEPAFVYLACIGPGLWLFWWIGLLLKRPFLL